MGADPDPGDKLVARNELTHGRNVGQRWPAGGGSYRERLHAASPNEFHGSGSAGEQHVHLAGNEFNCRSSPTDFMCKQAIELAIAVVAERSFLRPASMSLTPLANKKSVATVSLITAI